MCTLEEFKKQNAEEHSAIFEKLNILEPKITAAATISQTTKWIAGGLLVILVALVGLITYFSGMTYRATKHTSEVELSSFKRLNAIQDTIALHWKIETARYTNEIKPQEKWTHQVSDSFIMPTYRRALQNSKEIIKLKTKLK